MNTDDYNHIKTLKEAKRIIAEQDMIIGSQFRELTSLKDTQRRLNDCNSKRKREAGYDQWVSFDVVWDETLKKAQTQALHIPDVVKSFICDAEEKGGSRCETQCLGCDGFQRMDEAS